VYRITTIPTLADNLTYLVDDGKVAVVIDPGEASPVLRRLDEMALSLAAVLITHGHFDHRGGSDELQRRTGCEVVADAFGAIQEASERGFSFEIGPLVFHMLWTPGHSDDSGSYYLPPTQGFPGAVFTGDTLFVGGCGRIFTSSSATMWSSLQLLAALPAETLVLWPRLLPGELRICCDRRASQRRSQGAT